MDSSSYMKQIRDIVNEFKDSRGCITEQPTGKLLAKKLTDSEIQILRRFISLILYSDMLCEESKLYINNMNYSHRIVSEKMKEIYNKEISVSTVQSKIWYDKSKIEREIGADFIKDIIHYRKEYLIPEYSARIDRANGKYGIDRRLDSVLLIELPKTLNTKVEVADKEFITVLKILEAYTVKRKEKVENAIKPDVVQYLRYLISSDDNWLSDKDRANKNKVVNTLNI